MNNNSSIICCNTLHKVYRCRITFQSTPSPPTKSLDFRGFDSNKLLILRGGNYHIHIIV